MQWIRTCAAIIVVVGGLALGSPPALADGGPACCTSGDGQHTCCGETCWANANSCGASCTVQIEWCLPDPD